jgi:hypothetical protein
MLLKALTEALCTFGFCVITIQIRAFTKTRRKKFTSETEKELSQAIPSILKFYNNVVDVMKNNYAIIDFNHRGLPYDLLLKNSNCENLISINPKLNSYNLEMMLKLVNSPNRYPQVITIFSEKLNPILKNKKLTKRFIDSEVFKNTKHTIIQKAKSTFKNYETILLSFIIRYINK